jgi:hypothetical protein
MTSRLARATVVGAIALATLFAGRAVAATQTIETPGFRLRLEGEWKLRPIVDPEQRIAYSSAEDVEITTSYLPLPPKAPGTERVANKLKELRLDAENEAARKYHLRTTIAGPVVQTFQDGHMVAYYGHDDTGRQFRYLGLVFPDKVVNLYAESKSRSQAELETFFKKMLEGFAP